MQKADISPGEIRGEEMGSSGVFVRSNLLGLAALMHRGQTMTPGQLSENHEDRESLVTTAVERLVAKVAEAKAEEVKGSGAAQEIVEATAYETREEIRIALNLSRKAAERRAAMKR